jgi:hypothetical protein
MNSHSSDTPVKVTAVPAPASYGIGGIALALFMAAVGLLLNFI